MAYEIISFTTLIAQKKRLDKLVKESRAQTRSLLMRYLFDKAMDTFDQKSFEKAVDSGRYSTKAKR